MSSSKASPLRFVAAGVVVLIVIFMIVIGVSGKIAPANSDYTTSCVVTEKDRTNDRDGNSEMRIYTENCGTLVVKDNLLKGFWSSSDVYASIDAGKTYDFKATGFRIPIISSFPSIYEANEV